ncbi:hypothetical protein CGLO_14640 [Colletotrichum gloeosporioides Cg-14]|uniref:Uncharacterized protein n=1 Tax=Colletotrichum gloeosporioides (strain Cg-14) TaxID=1237896 RepID=T0L3T9_COLGC|nr:hypothetical protein CGLO_14640 [Colletotrichum gloeosporioides Cg-14]
MFPYQANKLETTASVQQQKD